MPVSSAALRRTKEIASAGGAAEAQCSIVLGLIRRPTLQTQFPCQQRPPPMPCYGIFYSPCLRWALQGHGRLCNGFRTPAQARTAARAPRAGVRKPPVKEGAGLGHQYRRGAMGNWSSLSVQQTPCTAIGASMGSPDVERPAGFDPIRAVFAVISRAQRRCQDERGPSGIDAGR